MSKVYVVRSKNDTGKRVFNGMSWKDTVTPKHYFRNQIDESNRHIFGISKSYYDKFKKTERVEDFFDNQDLYEIVELENNYLDVESTSDELVSAIEDVLLQRGMPLDMVQWFIYPYLDTVDNFYERLQRLVENRYD